ncbi:MAG TPA: hypothetical protein VD706_02665 [Candidatus Saccharimonadales bacterium]|nr:hypothetical protein [Candidatus Saccharimonadales bacterium]
MTPSPDTLIHAETGDFIGVFRPAAKEGADSPLVAVYEAKLPEAATGDVNAYRFRPATVIEDETIIAGPAVVTAAVEHPHDESDGHTHAEVAVAATGSEAAVDESVTSVFRDPSQFGKVVGLLAEREPVEVLNMSPDHTNLGPEGVQALGFSATGRPDILALELQESHAVAQAA